MSACWAGMSFSKTVRVADATAASTEAPGAATTFARSWGYRPVIALTASKTETCTMAIALTAMGVDGCRETMAAAFSFASVTTSARAHGAPANASAATRQSAMRSNLRLVFISCPPLPALRFGDLVVDIQAERQASRVATLGGATDGVIAGALHVAEEPLEAELAEEASAAGRLHRRLDGPDCRPPGHRPADQHLVRRLGR